VPDITVDTDIVADISYDWVEVLKKQGGIYNSICGPRFNDTCNATINDPDAWDYVRVRNIRNLPDGSEEETVIAKDINVIVFWKDGASTRSVNVRTMVVRKDDDFF
jgi:hypothetical protein